MPDLDIDRSSAAALPNEAKSSPRTIYSSALSFHDLVPAEPFSDTPNPNLSWLRKLLWLLPAALVIGALMPTNSWDFPTYLAIYCATLLVAWYFKRPLSLGGLGWIGLQGSLLFILSYVLYWPFHANFQQWYLGVDQIRDKSDLMGYLRIHGLFIFAIASYLLVETGRRYGRSAPLRGFGLWMRWWDHLPRLISLQRHLVRRTDGRVNLTLYAVAMVLALLLAIHVIGMTLVALLLGLLLWTAVLALHRDNPPEVLFSQVLVAVGFALSILVELVALKGDIGRMNTVFKFYLQIWMLWSVAAVICLTYTWRLIGRHWSVAWRQAWAIALAVLISAAIVYPLIATGARIRDRFDPSIPPTLDGTAFIERAVYRVENPQTKQGRDVRLRGDLAAIRWLQDNVAGSPVILEGWAPLYQWGARYSIYAGLPTVIGWDWHQKQQRWGYQVEVDRRLADVRTMYDTPAIEGATSLMDKYDVRYVVVGDLERVMYAAAGLAKFDQMVGRYLEVAYDSEGVKIYRRLKRE